MKKKLTIALISMPIYVFASQYVSLISKENKYLIGHLEVIEYTNWINDGLSYCVKDIEESDLYYNTQEEQTENCNQDQKRTKNVYLVANDGTKTLKSSTEENQTLLLSSNKKLITGTHLEKDCNSILNNGYSDGDGSYYIKPLSNEFIAYCDMTSDDGGWTRLVHQKLVFNSNYENELNAIFGNGVGKILKYQESAQGSLMYYKRKTVYSINFYENILETFRNTQNILNVDFTMNHNYKNLKTDTNKFLFCNYSNEPVPEHTYVGFPRDCGQSVAVGGRWLSMANSRGYAPWTTYNSNYTLWIK